MLTADSIMPIGNKKARRKKICELKPEYLFSVYNSFIGQNHNTAEVEEFLRYVESTWPNFKDKKTKIQPINELVEKVAKNSCPKEFFISESDAKYRLAYIRKRSVDNKNKVIPIRAYECPKCGYWHLTSQPKNGDKFQNDKPTNKNPETEHKFSSAWDKLIN